MKSYPSIDDIENAHQANVVSDAVYKHAVEAFRSGEPFPEIPSLSGTLTIQGNYFFFRDNRFTDGAIGLSNSDINELFEIVPDGTAVVIQR